MSPTEYTEQHPTQSEREQITYRLERWYDFSKVTQQLSRRTKLGSCFHSLPQSTFLQHVFTRNMHLSMVCIQYKLWNMCQKLTISEFTELSLTFTVKVKSCFAVGLCMQYLCSTTDQLWGLMQIRMFITSTLISAYLNFTLPRHLQIS